MSGCKFLIFQLSSQSCSEKFLDEALRIFTARFVNTLRIERTKSELNSMRLISLFFVFRPHARPCLLRIAHLLHTLRFNSNLRANCLKFGLSSAYIARICGQYKPLPT
jgi:hypothetical protein